MFFDLNKFKPINDKFGHAEGDHALQVFASQLKSVFRVSDYLARVGGDEFVALLPNTDQKTAEAVVERFMQSLTDDSQAANRGYELSCSHGVIQYDRLKHKTIRDLLAEGDRLMYHKKNVDRAKGPKLLFS